MAKHWKDPGNQRTQQEFKFEALDTTRSSGKSTSGRVVSTNVGVVKHWSSTESLAAPSSCEKGLCAMNKGAAEAMGIMSFAADMGITFDIMLRTDASAALGVVNRRGVEKTRHVDTLELWRCRRPLAMRTSRTCS